MGGRNAMRIAVLVVELDYGLDETAAVAASRLAHWVYHLQVARWSDRLFYLTMQEVTMIAVRKIVDCKDLRTGCVSEVAPAMMEGAEAEQ